MRFPAMLAFAALVAASLAHSKEPNMTSQPKILMIVTSANRMTSGKSTGLWLEEFAVPYLVFKDAGAVVTVASPKGGPAPIDDRSAPNAEQKAKWAGASEVLRTTKPLAEIDPSGFDAVFLPGGHGTMFDLPGNSVLARILEAFDARGAVIAAVCHGPAAFVGPKRKDGKPLVAGRKMTAFTDSEERAVALDEDVPFLLETRMRELGAIFEGGPDFKSHALRDERFVTGQNPASSGAAAQLVLDVLGKPRS